MDKPKTSWSFCSRVRRVSTRIAREMGVDPVAVMEAAVYLQRREREASEELLNARRAIRKRTGLTLNRIFHIEDSGKDHTSVIGLDHVARELAGEYPAIGIGQGYMRESNYDDTDHAALLWELLRKPDPVIRSQHDESLVAEAARIVKENHETVPF